MAGEIRTSFVSDLFIYAFLRSSVSFVLLPPLILNAYILNMVINMRVCMSVYMGVFIHTLVLLNNMSSCH